MLTRDIGKAHELLDNVKQVAKRNANPTFTKETNLFDIGYAQAHKDMLSRINIWENKRDLSDDA